jgi:hypothetical protein
MARALASIQQGLQGIVSFVSCCSAHDSPPKIDSFNTGIPLVSEQGILDLGSLDLMHRLVNWMSSSMARSVMFICHISRGAELPRVLLGW